MLRLLSLLLLLSLSTSTFADDAVEAVAPNELTFEKTPYLIMQDETLTISKTAKNFMHNDYDVDVLFHFKNISDQPINRTIAFAFPPVSCHDEMNTMWQGLDTDFKEFKLLANGKKVKYKKRITASLNNKDITDLLTQLKIPLNPCQIKFTKDGKIDPKYAAILKENNLLTAETNLPAWTENIYFEWQQTFPVGKILEISHHYRPIIGTTVPSGLTVEDINNYFTNQKPSLTSYWNRSPSELERSNPQIVIKQNNETRFCLIPSWVLYRLTTGAYWNGGIGTFKLIINDSSGAPFAVNQFFTDADNAQVQKSAYQMSFVLNSFVPKQDLYILYLALPKTKDDLKFCGI